MLQSRIQSVDTTTCTSSVKSGKRKGKGHMSSSAKCHHCCHSHTLFTYLVGKKQKICKKWRQRNKTLNQHTKAFRTYVLFRVSHSEENISSKGLSVLIQSLVSLPPFLTDFFHPIHNDYQTLNLCCICPS